MLPHSASTRVLDIGWLILQSIIAEAFPYANGAFIKRLKNNRQIYIMRNNFLLYFEVSKTLLVKKDLSLTIFKLKFTYEQNRANYYY